MCAVELWSVKCGGGGGGVWRFGGRCFPDVLGAGGWVCSIRQGSNLCEESRTGLGGEVITSMMVVTRIMRNGGGGVSILLVGG